MRTISRLFLLGAFLMAAGSVSAQKFAADGSMLLAGVATDTVYGRQPDHRTSIKVGSIDNEYTYLRSLRGPNGEPVKTNRLSSCCGFETEKSVFGAGLLDKWAITWEGQETPLIIYLNGYDFEAPKCPAGLTIKEGSAAN